MNCDELLKVLSEGQPLSDAARAHLLTCAKCGQVESLFTTEAAAFDPAILAQVQGNLSSSLKPVRPLPSDSSLILRLLMLFAVFACIMAVPVGYSGIHVRSVTQRLVEYSATLLSALALSIVLVQLMIPGARRRLDARAILIAVPIVLAGLAFLLYYSFNTDHFVLNGMPCLRLGALCAAGMGLFSWFILRRGFYTLPVVAMTTAGVYAGLSGVAVLALHCPQLNALHILVWHFGAMLLAGFGGALLGFFLSRLANRSS